MSFTPKHVGIFLGAVVVAFVIFFIFKKLRPYKIKYVRTTDPEAQAQYEKQTIKKNEESALSLQERIELSWQFLTRITQQVIELFSSADKEQVLESGRKLVKNGAKYQHNVYQESLVIKSSKTKTTKKAKGEELSI
jgi:hypothetical protein